MKTISFLTGWVSTFSLAISFIGLDCLIFAANPELKEKLQKTSEIPSVLPEVKLPAAQGKGPSLLLFFGGRPWFAYDFQIFMVLAGYKVTLLNSVYLDNFGGASTKKHLTDHLEPPKLDGLTPAFKLLDQYRVIMVDGILGKMQQKLFTPERIDALKRYIQNGGTLIITRDAPLGALGEISPVSAGKLIKDYSGYLVSRPTSPKFQEFPEKWNCLSPFAMVKAVRGSETLSELRDSSGVGAAPYIAIKKLGKGRVLFFNDSWTRRPGITAQLCEWAYGKALIAELVSEVGRLALNPSKKLLAMPQPPPRKQHGNLKLTVAPPVMELRSTVTAPKIDGKQIEFDDGMKIEVADDGSLNFYRPGQVTPFLHQALPRPGFFGKVEKFDSDTGEAISGEFKAKKSSATWTVNDIEAFKDGMVAVNYSGSDSSQLTWVFKSGFLNLNGRIFTAFADKIIIKSSPNIIETMDFTGQIVLGTDAVGLRSRRMACYSSVRGYMDYDLSGQNAVKIPRWQFFCSGQPFIYLNSPEAVFAEFPDAPIPFAVDIEIAQGERKLTRNINLLVGRRKAPMELPFVWHVWSKGPEDSCNEYIAIWQLVRKHLREVSGIKSFPHYTRATWSSSPEDERAKVYAAASKFGFQMMRLAWCPSPMERMASPQAAKTYQQVRSVGMIPRPWTPGGYIHGVTEDVYVNHPDWFIHKADGSLYGYFHGQYPVADFNNPKFLEWYFALVRRAKAAGMGAIYMDMLGAASQLINYKGPECGTQLDGIVKVFRFLSEENLPFAIEGMNPLAVDNYLYRRQFYTPFTGNEFALLGAGLATRPGDEFSVDFFRQAMYNATMRVDLDGYVNNFERTPGEFKYLERIRQLLPQVNRAFSLFTLPIIVETPFGTMWTEKDRAALFFYDSVKSLTLNLPENWEVEGIAGSQLNNIKTDTIVFIRKIKASDIKQGE